MTTITSAVSTVAEGPQLCDNGCSKRKPEIPKSEQKAEGIFPLLITYLFQYPGCISPVTKVDLI